MTETICKEGLCTGCGACVQICPTACISMKADAEGFWYPTIDRTQCINCHLCDRQCPVLAPKNSFAWEKHYYAAYNKKEMDRLASSSGGFFTLLAEQIIKQGGVVFGAAFMPDFSVEHIVVDNFEELYKLRGSKYVQSKIGNCYKAAKKYLEQGRKVLFTGTPCQISGLNSFLGREYGNLYTQDIICHGVPSPLVWEKYIKYREKKAASKTQRTFFRHKKYGWKMYSVQFEFENCTEYIQVHSADLYMVSFLRNWSLRPSCYECSFKGLDRSSDITLADFWGIDNIAPEMNDDKGCSLVMVNSQKGQDLFNSIADNVCSMSVDINEAVKYNSSAISSVKIPEQREKFLKKVKKVNFERAVRSCSKQKKNGSFVRRAIKKVLGGKLLLQ